MILENRIKAIKLIYVTAILVTIYYSIITIMYLFFLAPVIVLWAIGVEDIEFINTLNSSDINRTDISYFTTGSNNGCTCFFKIIFTQINQTYL